MSATTLGLNTIGEDYFQDKTKKKKNPQHLGLLERNMVVSQETDDLELVHKEQWVRSSQELHATTFFLF